MIVCPNCKEEIEDDSRFCDQCGQLLLYCEKCGRVGMGRRCTSCGGMMLAAEDFQERFSQSGGMSVASLGFVSQRSPVPGYVSLHTTGAGVNRGGQNSSAPLGAMPQLQLNNDSLGIRIIGINGAVIGRRQGPYAHFFKQQMYISGVHAQLFYHPDNGWSIVDKHSSNGTKLNDHQLQPDVEMSLKHGDIVKFANVVLKVSII